MSNEIINKYSAAKPNYAVSAVKKNEFNESIEKTIGKLDEKRISPSTSERTVAGGLSFVSLMSSLECGAYLRALNNQSGLENMAIRGVNKLKWRAGILGVITIIVGTLLGGYAFQKKPPKDVDIDNTIYGLNNLKFDL